MMFHVTVFAQFG